MRLFEALHLVLPLLTLVVSQVTSAPILLPRFVQSINNRSIRDEAYMTLGRRALPESASPSIPTHLTGSAFSGHLSSPKHRLSRRSCPVHVEVRSYDGGGLLRPSGPAAGSSLAKRMVHMHFERRWWLFDKIKEGFQNFGRKVKEGFQNFGNKVKEGFQKVGNFVKHAATKVKEGFQHAAGKVKEGFQKVGNFVKHAANKVKEGFQHAAGKVKEGFQKFGEKIKYAAGKVKDGLVKAGHWIKDNAGKVAKFGLKIWSTAVSVVGRVASFIPIPGLNKAVGKAIGGVSKLADIVADKIPGQLGDKLEKGWNVMTKIQHPISTALKGAAGKVLDNILRR